jgi:hypothetical protein
VRHRDEKGVLVLWVDKAVGKAALIKKQRKKQSRALHMAYPWSGILFSPVGSFGRLRCARCHHEMFVSARAMLLPAQLFRLVVGGEVGEQMWASPATAELLPSVMSHLMQLILDIWHLPCALGKHRYSHALAQLML